MVIPCLVQNGQPIFAITRSPSFKLQADSYLYFVASSCSVEELEYKAVDSATTVHNRLMLLR
jgi:hypothetical protein